MKNLQLFLAFCFLALSTSGFGQQSNNTKEVNALRLHKDVAKLYQNGLTVQGFSVDAAGILRPDEGYHILFNTQKKRFIVKSKSIKNPLISNIDSFPIPSGTLWCHCGFGSNDDCKYWHRVDGGDTLHKCLGNCGCDSMFVPKPNSVIEFQTSDGGWHNP